MSVAYDLQRPSPFLRERKATGRCRGDDYLVLPRPRQVKEPFRPLVIAGFQRRRGSRGQTASALTPLTWSPTWGRASSNFDA